MGKSDASSITSNECRNVLDSIQNEYEKKQREDSILSKLQEDLNELIAQRNVLGKRKDFNEKYCVLCCSAFNLLFKRKVLCQVCSYYICRSCSLWNNIRKQWICNVCEKQRVLLAESKTWICNRIKYYFGTFGAAKVLQNFCRLKKLADSESDSGYGPTNDFLPLMKLLSSNSLNKDFKMAEMSSHDGECEDDEDDVGDEEELAEIHHSIETILEGLLGSPLDDASVDHLFPNSSLYMSMFLEFHPKLVDAIQNLSKALQKALHNLPVQEGLTPTSAHAALKSVITVLVDKCQDFPEFQHSNLHESLATLGPEYQYADVFSSYESLVAAAVINKVVEESQSKFKNAFISMEDTYEIKKGSQDHLEAESRTNLEDQDFEYSKIEDSNFDLPVECVQIEEIEEITQEISDIEEDKQNGNNLYTKSPYCLDEMGLPKDIDLLDGIDLVNDKPTPFPEFGCDLIENGQAKVFNTTQHLTSISSWEENWLFRKKKRLPLYSNMKYQLLSFCEEPPCMLIPQPSEAENLSDQDELLSELSETQSAGSLEFSSDSDEVKADPMKPIDLSKPTQIADLGEKDPPKSLRPTPLESSLPVFPTDRVAADEGSEKCHSKESSENKININKDKHPLPVAPDSLPDLKTDRQPVLSSIKKEESDNTSFEAHPPRPGTIAEREHQKWLNAVPLKHNPYSAENICKRSSFGKKAVLDDHVSSFEEFERKYSLSSAEPDPALKKVNCGPKSIDSELYQRDYYINHHKEYNDSYPLKKSSKHQYSFSEDNFDMMSEEALNSFEEKVYISSGKVFTLENHVKRLEREIKDLSPTSDFAKDTSFVPMISSKEMQESNASNKVEVEKLRKNKPSMKIHSLTARSLSREFRDLAKINLPKPMNMTIQVAQPPEVFANERDGLCSPESIHSSFSTQGNDNNHGYTSDESNTSANSAPRTKSQRHISRSILERASYWERRAEQGLLSDASVNEEFPPIEINP